MTARSSMLSTAGLAIAAVLGIGIASASAQAVYVDPYVEPYPVVVGPGSVYVAPAPILAPAPIVRERVVVRPPAYIPAPTYHPTTRYGYDYVRDVGYAVADWW